MINRGDSKSTSTTVSIDTSKLSRFDFITLRVFDLVKILSFNFYSLRFLNFHRLYFSYYFSITTFPLHVFFINFSESIVALWNSHNESVRETERGAKFLADSRERNGSGLYRVERQRQCVIRGVWWRKVRRTERMGRVRGEERDSPGRCSLAVSGTLSALLARIARTHERCFSYSPLACAD